MKFFNLRNESKTTFFSRQGFKRHDLLKKIEIHFTSSICAVDGAKQNLLFTQRIYMSDIIKCESINQFLISLLSMSKFPNLLSKIK